MSVYFASITPFWKMNWSSGIWKVRLWKINRPIARRQSCGLLNRSSRYSSIHAYGRFEADVIKVGCRNR